MPGVPILTATDSLYRSWQTYVTGAGYNIPSFTHSLNLCDLQYRVCKEVETEIYNDCNYRCSLLWTGAQSQCYATCSHQLQEVLSNDCAKWLCTGDSDCQLDVQDPNNRPPRCCPSGQLNCGQTCVPDCDILRRINKSTCRCDCVSVSCPAPKVQDVDTCLCRCPAPCPPTWIQDPDTCACSCPQVATHATGFVSSCQNRRTVANVVSRAPRDGTAAGANASTSPRM